MSKNVHYYRDGEVVLYKRDESRFWQSRFKLADMKWHRLSTKTSNLEVASKIARDLYDESRFKLKHDMPQTTKRFSDVANLAIKEMETDIKNGIGKSVYPTYIAVIRLHLIPYFGKKHIDRITPKDFDGFTKHYEEKTGKKLKTSTITNHNTSIYRIFDLAMNKGWVTKVQYPQLKNRGESSTRRPAFTMDEWKVIYRKLIKWSKSGDTLKTQQMRQLLRDYVLILGNTGMRPGTETSNLKWKHVSWNTEKDGERQIMLSVSGKTGERVLVARHTVVSYLKRIQSRFPELSKYSFDELLKKQLDIPVFRLEGGEVTKNLNQSFRQFLIHCDLLEDVHGNERVLYSLRHMYATFALVRHDVNIHLLAKQMGTSVGMLEKHYSHLQPVMNARELAGERLPK